MIGIDLGTISDGEKVISIPPIVFKEFFRIDEDEFAGDEAERNLKEGVLGTVFRDIKGKLADFKVKEDIVRHTALIIRRLVEKLGTSRKDVAISYSIPLFKNIWARKRILGALVKSGLFKSCTEALHSTKFIPAAFAPASLFSELFGNGSGKLLVAVCGEGILDLGLVEIEGGEPKDFIKADGVKTNGEDIKGEVRKFLGEEKVDFTLAVGVEDLKLGKVEVASKNVVAMGLSRWQGWKIKAPFNLKIWTGEGYKTIIERGGNPEGEVDVDRNDVVEVAIDPVSMKVKELLVGVFPERGRLRVKINDRIFPEISVNGIAIFDSWGEQELKDFVEQPFEVVELDGPCKFLPKIGDFVAWNVEGGEDMLVKAGDKWVKQVVDGTVKLIRELKTGLEVGQVRSVKLERYAFLIYSSEEERKKHGLPTRLKEIESDYAFWPVQIKRP